MIDPFGFATATDNLSQDLALLVMAPFYRLGVVNELMGWDKIGSAPITVVLIDEETLSVLGTGYPLDDDTLTELLQKIACAGPTTMFLDVLLGDPRPGGLSVSRELLELLAAGAAASERREPPAVKVPGHCEWPTPPMPPFYVADIPPSEAQTMGGDGRAQTILAPKVQAVARRLPVQWTGDAYLYPTRLAYSGSIEAGGWATLPGVKLPTPALQLYQDMRQAEWERHAKGRKAVTPPPTDITGLPDEMVIGWGWKHRQLPKWYTQLHADPKDLPSKSFSPCSLVPTNRDPFPEQWASRTWEAFRIALSQLVLSLASPLRSWCSAADGDPPQKYVYTLIVPAWQILANSRAVPQDAIRHALHDRAVLIGQNVIGGADTVNTPVHGSIPGVVTHAQALDNFLYWGARVWQPMPSIENLPPGISFGLLLGLTYVFVLGFLEAFLPTLGISVDKTAFLLAILTIAIAFFRAIVLCWAPINWIGLLITLLWDPIEERISKK